MNFERYEDYFRIDNTNNSPGKSDFLKLEQPNHFFTDQNFNFSQPSFHLDKEFLEEFT